MKVQNANPPSFSMMQPSFQTLMNSHGHLIKKWDYPRYLSLLISPRKIRTDIIPLYAFYAEITAIIRSARAIELSEMRLMWWYEALQGMREEEANAVPLFVALTNSLMSPLEDRQKLADFIEAKRFDLYSEPHQSLEQVQDYYLKSESVIFEIASDIASQHMKNNEYATLDTKIKHDIMLNAGVLYGLTRDLCQLNGWYIAHKHFFDPEFNSTMNNAEFITSKKDDSQQKENIIQLVSRCEHAKNNFFSLYHNHFPNYFYVFRPLIIANYSLEKIRKHIDFIGIYSLENIKINNIFRIFFSRL